jgi:hypothetical protein
VLPDVVLQVIAAMVLPLNILHAGIDVPFQMQAWCCKLLIQLVQIAAFLCCELILSCSNLASASAAAPFASIYQWYAKYLGVCDSTTTQLHTDCSAHLSQQGAAFALNHADL